MTWAPLLCAGKIRGIKDAETGQRIVRWDGICDGTTDWGQANWRLMLVAPEMLEALESLLAYALACEGLLNASESGQCRKAGDVIKKVRGRNDQHRSHN